MEDPSKDQTNALTAPPESKAEAIDRNCELHQEMLSSAAWRDVHKTRLLREVARLHPGEVDHEAAIALADNLEPKFNAGAPVCHPTYVSPASSLFTISDQLQRFAELNNHFYEWGEHPYRFKVYPRGWAFDLNNLMQVDAPELIESLSSTFEQIGLDAYHGILIGYLHVEYDPARNHCRLSLAGTASQGPAKLISRLDRFPIFRDFPWGDAFWDEGCLGDPFVNRVSVIAVHGPAHPQAELYQNRWPLCATILNGERKFERVKDHRGLPELVEAKIALWLDQFDLSDLTFMVGADKCESGVDFDSPFNGSDIAPV